MKRNTRKGFTGIELVIVIAIIAILAASLIPAFGGLIDGANKTADLQGAREMDAAIKMGSLGKKVDLPQVIKILDEAGFDVTSLKPLYKGHKFYWSNEGQTIVLYDENAGKVTYPEGQLYAPANGEELMSGSGFFVTEVASPADFAAAIKAGTSVQLTAPITLTKEDGALNITAANTVIDLNGNSLTLDKESDMRTLSVTVSAGASLEFKGEGTVTLRAIINNGNITLNEGVEIHAVDITGGGCVRNKTGATVVINGGKFVVDNSAPTQEQPYGGGANVIRNDGGTVTINGGVFESANKLAYVVSNNGGTTTINNGTFVGEHGVVANDAGNTIVNGGTFTTNSTGSSYPVYCSAGTVEVNGGTFTGGAYTFYDKNIPGATVTGTITDNRTNG